MWFNGLIDRIDFSAALGKRNLALVGATLSWPFILAALMPLTRCGGIGGACGAVGLLLSMYLKPCIYLVFVATLFPICVKRCRDSGVSVWTVPPVLIILFTGIGFWTIASAPWSLSFSLGALGGVPPVVVAGFATLVFMCFALSNTRPRHFEGFVVLLSIVALLPVTLSYLVFHSMSVAGGMPRGFPLSPMLQAVAMFTSWSSLLLDAAPFVLATMALREWKKSSRFEEQDFQKTLVLGLGLIVSLASLFCLAVSLASSIALLVKIKMPLLSMLQVTSYVRLVELLALLVLPFAISAQIGDVDGFVEPAQTPFPNRPRERAMRVPGSASPNNRRAGFGKRQIA